MLALGDVTWDRSWWQSGEERRGAELFPVAEGCICAVAQRVVSAHL